jgi:hypothetical protein
VQSPTVIGQNVGGTHSQLPPEVVEVGVGVKVVVAHG